MASKRTREPIITKVHDPMHEWLDDALGTLPSLGIRRLFGGAGIYSGETIFGILYAGQLYLKTDERTRAAFVRRGARALRARSGTVLTAYYEVPPDVLDDEEELLRWARLALEVAIAGLAQPRQRRRR